MKLIILVIKYKFLFSDLLGKIKKDNIYLIKYAFIGVLGASLDFCIFALLTQRFYLYYIYANIISVSVGISNNFIFNVLFNFKVKNNIFGRFMKFYTIGVLGMGISIGILYILVEMIQINSLVAKIITMFSVPLIQFYLNKHITFKGYEEKKCE